MGTAEAGTGLSGQRLSTLYRERFTPKELAFKRRMWRTFVARYFQRFFALDEVVLDLGAGNCEFINTIECGEKLAVDLNPDLARLVEGAKAIVRPSRSIPEVPTGSVDVVFTSNFFEHLPDKRELLSTLQECHRMLRPDGRIMILMPNIRYLPGRYWDYLDHHLALTHHSLVEALVVTGYRPELVRAKTLPYTIKYTRVPRWPWLVDLYMLMPVVWPLFGKQMFVIARSVEIEDEDASP
jgi:SAM-dependent methyltransferase